MHSKHSSEDAVRFFVARRPKKISQHLLTGVLNACQFLHPRFKFARSYEVSHFYPPENGGLAKTSYLEYFDVFRVGFGALAMIRYYYSVARRHKISQHLLTSVLNTFQFLHSHFKSARSYYERANLNRGCKN